MQRSLWAVIVGTFTLRFSTGLTGTLLVYYLADLPAHGGEVVSPLVVGVFGAVFFAAELLLSPAFGSLGDRVGYHRVMELGPFFGFVAVILTGLTTNTFLLGITRALEGASSAASIPSILGYIALVTAGDVALRGKASARFEAATLAGLGAGMVVAGPLWTLVGPVSFFLNAGVYVGSWAIYRFGVRDARADHAVHHEHRPGSPRRYVAILRASHVWLLAPTWIAVNAAIGLWTGQSIFQLVREPPPEFADQALMGGFSPIAISAGFVVAGVVFFAGLIWWGNRFRKFRRTTIIGLGVAGGAALAVAGLVVNHGADASWLVLAAALAAAAAGLFVLAGATPAALGLLADMSEAYPHDRGAIMGLYSVFLALGQIGGSLLGGVAADLRGIDGLLVATLVLLAIAVLPLWRLRAYEHRIEPTPDTPPVTAAD
ncbi:MAG: MFS transporter [Chloroflexi bacterium]|nr:MFS transporter [Chloroflexota bacterium]